MDGVVALVGRLLSGLHGVFGLGICPGDWLWTTAAAGGVIALLPVVTAIVVALIRKVSGNRYTLGTVAVFIGLGVLGNFLLPFWLFGGASQVFRTLAAGGTSLGMSGVGSLTEHTCFVLPSQNQLLGGSPRVGLAITSYESAPVRWVSIAALVVVPAFVLFWITRQAKQAFRGGARWPARLYYAPFLAFALLTAELSAGVTGLLWLGFLPVSALGVLVVKAVGTPSDAVLHPAPAAAPQQSHQAHQSAHTPAAQPSQPRSQVQQHQPPPAQTQRPLAQQPPPRPNPPTRVYEQAPQPQPVRQQPQPRPALPPVAAASAAAPLAGLADTPGPLPWMRDKPVTPTTTANLDAPTKFDATGDSFGGRFRRIRQLGQGGFGKVWLAMDASLGRKVAIKIAHATDPDSEQRMLREARALAAVRHPHCVRVYDILEDADGLAIVMEYVEGPSLAQALHDNGLVDDVAAARLWVTMAGALGAAHEKSVLHRDLKPSNVIIDQSGTAHLIDFGLARRRGDSTLTATGMMMGTPDFLAPEVARGEQASPASDAWQLAATVSYALTGHPPRGSRDNPMAALMAAANGEPCNRLPERSVHRRLLMASLDKDPNRRPTLGRVQQQLDGWLHGAGLTHEGPVTTVVRRP
ncbi:serine/threonine-protein kinase [Kutzneria viridogrisea]|uniref:non-specific serine/threonine protein kinase n=1 Tax=Kutzneria viridogrisea TaxID=47990 RepID=A0ABR6BK00_9PSEU|nr:putative Ser/Thr protein kinase [Kutzneria viridogrisea]